MQTSNRVYNFILLFLIHAVYNRLTTSQKAHLKKRELNMVLNCFMPIVIFALFGPV